MSTLGDWPAGSRTAILRRDTLSRHPPSHPSSTVERRDPFKDRRPVVRDVSVTDGVGRSLKQGGEVMVRSPVAESQTPPPHLSFLRETPPGCDDAELRGGMDAYLFNNLKLL